MENESHSVHIYVDSISLLEEFILSRACLMTTQISLYLKLSKWVHIKRPAPVPLKLESKDFPGKTLALTPAEVPVRISLNPNLSGARGCSRALSETSESETWPVLNNTGNYQLTELVFLFAMTKYLTKAT